MCEIPQAHRLIVAASCPQYAAFAANSPNVKLSVSSHSSKTLQLTLTRGASKGLSELIWEQKDERRAI